MDVAQACARCGRDADFDIADLWLCLDCYHIAGSTCAGVGRRGAATPSSGAQPEAAKSKADTHVDPVC